MRNKENLLVFVRFQLYYELFEQILRDLSRSQTIRGAGWVPKCCHGKLRERLAIEYKAVIDHYKRPISERTQGIAPQAMHQENELVIAARAELNVRASR